MDPPLFAAAFDPTALWPDYRPTELIELPRLAGRTGVGRVFVKLENQRPLGNFKSLGGYCAGLRALAHHVRAGSPGQLRQRALPPLLCASEGNHGLAVAAAARFAGTRACVYLPDEVPAQRAERIARLGSEVIRVTGTYDDAVERAREAEMAGVGLLIPDTSDDPHHPVVADVMDGYAVIAQELACQFGPGFNDRPSHALVQAGVGGLAAAMARGLAGQWQGPGRLLTVEPADAASVALALEHGRPRLVEGDLASAATMLACGMASASAVAILLRHGAQGLTVSESQLEDAVAILQDTGGPASTISGAAGVAGLLKLAGDADLRAAHALDADSRVLLLVTEGAQDSWS